MTTVTEYPLIPRLESIKRRKFNNQVDRLNAIASVLDEEAFSRWTESDSDRSIPDQINRQSKYRWDVARCIFNSKEMQNLINTREVENSITQSHLLCVQLGGVFYKMAATLFYTFYDDGSSGGSGLTNEENNEIIKSIFGDDFEKLNEAFHSWMVGHIERMLTPHPTWGVQEPINFANKQAKHYRETYAGAFFMPHIEEAIKNVMQKA